MTCIVGYVSEGAVYLGGDSSITLANLNVNSKTSKVFRNGEYIMGNCGSCRMGDILEYTFKPPKVKEGGEYDHKFMCTDFVDELMIAYGLAEFDPLKVDSEDNYVNGGAIIVGIRGRMFEICEDYSCIEYTDHHYAIGCGHNIARGAVYALDEENKKLPKKQKKSAEYIVEASLEAASYYMGAVAPPFNIISTK